AAGVLASAGFFLPSPLYSGERGESQRALTRKQSMRKVFLSVALLALIAPKAPAQSAWADKLFGGKTTHHFGTVARGSQLVHTFTMTNIYTVPLDITNIRSTCGCLTATPSTKRLKPQETGTLH